MRKQFILVCSRPRKYRRKLAGPRQSNSQRLTPLDIPIIVLATKANRNDYFYHCSRISSCTFSFELPQSVHKHLVPPKNEKSRRNIIGQLSASFIGSEFSAIFKRLSQKAHKFSAVLLASSANVARYDSGESNRIVNNESLAC